MSPMTEAQSPGIGCRNNRAFGYHTVSARPSCQRQSGAYGSNIHTGRPMAPAKCATAVSTVINRSSAPNSAIVSVKSRSAGPASNTSGCPASCCCAAPRCKDTSRSPLTARSGAKVAKCVERLRSFWCSGEPAQTMPMYFPGPGRAPAKRARQAATLERATRKYGLAFVDFPQSRGRLDNGR
jgi:hypothetical protein